MDISALNNVVPSYLTGVADTAQQIGSQDKEFSGILQSMMNMLNEANDAQNKASEAEMQFELGYATNTHDLNAAQTKADIALNYTIAVRDRMLEAYKEIMNMQV
ncbi:MAG: flagellar hook-basal body complex protein FliE [Lachnospiraceae bacterium]|nr:flagellar hook-basal body complex protein FliE [Lachnospiraceae bacterium]